MVILLTAFVTGWVDVLPNPADSLALILVPPIIVITLIVSAGGLSNKKKKILRVYSSFVFCVCLGLSVYFVMFGGEQGGIGAFFAWFFAGLSCAGIYLILVAVNFVQKYRSEHLPKNV